MSCVEKCLVFSMKNMSSGSLWDNKCEWINYFFRRCMVKFLDTFLREIKGDDAHRQLFEQHYWSKIPYDFSFSLSLQTLIRTWISRLFFHQKIRSQSCNFQAILLNSLPCVSLKCCENHHRIDNQNNLVKQPEQCP